MARGKNRGMPTLVLFTVLLVGIVGGCLSSCKNEQPATHPINQAAVVLRKKPSKIREATRKREVSPAKNTILSNKMPTLRQKHPYHPRIESLRDPFVPFIRFNERVSKEKHGKPLLPLQKYALSQLRLIAVIDAGSKGRWAMVCDPSGKGFTVRKGVPIGNEGGVVEKILIDRLIVKEVKVDLLGKKKIKFITMVLRPEKRGE